MAWSRIHRLHGFVRKKAWPLLLAIAAVTYRAAQEIGYFPKDVFFFPLLVGVFVFLCLYMIVTSAYFLKGLERFYEILGKDHCMAAYSIVVLCGAIIGGAMAAGGYRLFEIHKKHIQALSNIESGASKEHITPGSPPQEMQQQGSQTQERSSSEGKSAPQPPKAKPQDQGFREKPPDTAYFSLGGGGITTGYSLEALRKSEANPFQLGGFVPVRIHLKNDTLYCDVKLWGGQGNPPIEIKNNEFTVRRPGWDRNFTANALEVVNEKGMPIFQLIRKTPTHYVANGYFIFSGGLFVATDRGTTQYGNPNRVDIPTGVLTQIFKYPSWKFPGKYADNSN